MTLIRRKGGEVQTKPEVKKTSVIYIYRKYLGTRILTLVKYIISFKFKEDTQKWVNA